MTEKDKLLERVRVYIKECTSLDKESFIIEIMDRMLSIEQIEVLLPKLK